MALVVGVRTSPIESCVCEGEQALAGCFLFGVEFFAGVGDDFGDGFAAAGEDEALAGFHFCDAGGEVLIGFAEGDFAHGWPLVVIVERSALGGWWSWPGGGLCVAPSALGIVGWPDLGLRPRLVCCRAFSAWVPQL